MKILARFGIVTLLIGAFGLLLAACAGPTLTQSESISRSELVQQVGGGGGGGM